MEQTEPFNFSLVEICNRVKQRRGYEKYVNLCVSSNSHAIKAALGYSLIRKGGVPTTEDGSAYLIWLFCFFTGCPSWHNPSPKGFHCTHKLCYMLTTHILRWYSTKTAHQVSSNPSCVKEHLVFSGKIQQDAHHDLQHNMVLKFHPAPHLQHLPLSH